MKKIKFDTHFKQAILNKEMVATIRNSKKVDVGEVFDVVIDGEVLSKAECKAVEWISVVMFLRHLGYKHTMRENWIEYKKSRNTLSHYNLGFLNWLDAINSYEAYLKNEHCYLHIFELIED